MRQTAVRAMYGASGEDRFVRVELFRGALLELVQRAGSPEVVDPGISAFEVRDHMPSAELDTVKRQLGALVRMGLVRKEPDAGGGEERYLPMSARASEASEGDQQKTDTRATHARMTRRH